jgi:hypothetical protein
VNPVVLQLCQGFGSGPDSVNAFEFVEAFACTYAAPMGLGVVGLLVYGGIGLSLFARTGDVRVPFVVLILTGGAITSQIAAPGLTIITLLVLFSGAGLMTYLYYRYSR